MKLSVKRTLKRVGLPAHRAFNLRFHIHIAVAFILAVGAALVVAAAEPSSDQQFLAGLRARGLYGLAEKYCTDRLAGPERNDAQRADLTIELARILAEQAAALPPDERQPLWQRATEVTAQFVEQHPQNPRLLLVQLQSALTRLDCGELTRQEAELLGGDTAHFDRAREPLRAAAAQLAALDEVVEEQIRRPPAGHDQLSPEQLQSLRNAIQYQLARAYRNQALAYPADSPDRTNSLLKATRLLEFLSKLDAADPLAYPSRLALVRCHRQLGDYPQAQRHLEALLGGQIPPRVRLKARAERVQLLLATERLNEALAVVGQGRSIGGLTLPEFDDAALAAYLVAWRAAVESGNDDQARAWQQRATGLVQTIDALYGPYWGRRAEMRLAGYVGGLPGGSLDMLTRAAESAYRSGNLDEALAAYDRAAAEANSQGRAEQAFDLGYTAAAIEHHRNRHDQALGRFRQLAMSRPQHARASQAHLLAIYHAAQLARRKSPGALDHYVALLDEHLKTWPEASTANSARAQLARLREYQGDWQGAIAAYRAVSPEAEGHQAAVDGAVRCYRAWLASRRAAGQDTQAIAREAARWLESLLLDAQGRLPERWSPLARHAVLSAARLRLSYTPDGYAPMESLLTQALAGAADAPEDWKAEARALLVFSLAGQGKRREAAEALEHLSAGPADGLLTMLDGLGRMADAAAPQVRRELAELQLRTIELLGRSKQPLEAGQQQRVERLYAQALADAGRTLQARQAYQALAEAHPRDGAIQESYARLLLEAEDRATLDAALAKWRELEKRSPAGSPRWFRTKYAVAELHYRQGNPAQAVKIITLLKVLHPELGGAEMRARFEALLAKCQP